MQEIQKKHERENYKWGVEQDSKLQHNITQEGTKYTDFGTAVPEIYVTCLTIFCVHSDALRQEKKIKFSHLDTKIAEFTPMFILNLLTFISVFNKYQWQFVIQIKSNIKFSWTQ